MRKAVSDSRQSLDVSGGEAMEDFNKWINIQDGIVFMRIKDGKVVARQEGKIPKDSEIHGDYIYENLNNILGLLITETWLVAHQSKA